MTPSARLSAAIEVLDDVILRRRPAADALKDWGLARRFAGSKDRAAVASLVYDALRRRASSAFVMGSETPRALVLAMLVGLRAHAVEEVAGLCSGEGHAPAPLEQEERDRLSAFALDGAPEWVRADVPEWLWSSLAAGFGDEAVEEGQSLATRAPIDIRANRLRITRSALQRELASLAPEPGAWSPDALRFQVGPDGRGASLQSEPSFFSGGFEIQDEGSQLVTLLAAPQPGSLVVDLCAGAGGKTLALAALMANSGRLLATDIDARRLAPLHDRLARSGAGMVEVRIPRGRGHDALADIGGQADLVLVDAPCTGTGTWRRNPDAKWRVRPGALAERIRDQSGLLDRAASLAKPGGRVAYITCSVLPEENDGAIDGVLARHGGLTVLPLADVLAKAQGDLSLLARFGTRHGLQLSPRRTGTDGFYLAILSKAG